MVERALKNTIIAKDYSLSLKSLFKDKYKYWDDSYAIPFSEFNHCKKYLFDFIKSSCNGDDVCGKLNMRYGHQFMQFILAIINFQRAAIIEHKMFYKYFFISNFELSSNAKMTLIPVKITKWRVIAIESQKLDGLTYSERLTYLQ